MENTNSEGKALVINETSPSLAQTHMQGPLTTGSGKPLTKDELDAVKKELEIIKKEFGYKEPNRSFMDEPDTVWRFGGKPDYSLTNLLYLKQRTTQHKEDSLEHVVENLVKTWEMERSHKPDHTVHRSVDQEKFRISANGGKVFANEEANQVGNYNVLLNACPADLYDAENTSWDGKLSRCVLNRLSHTSKLTDTESLTHVCSALSHPESHDLFHTAFAAFPWEVLEVYSPPPKVAFTWRHWGQFTGTFEETKGEGQVIEMFGFGTAVVNDKLQLTEVEIFYDPKDFFAALRGNKKPEEVNKTWKTGACPFEM